MINGRDDLTQEATARILALEKQQLLYVKQYSSAKVSRRKPNYTTWSHADFHGFLVNAGTWISDRKTDIDKINAAYTAAIREAQGISHHKMKY
eukprot:3518127-Pyramimonas_sp.AAC.2